MYDKRSSPRLPLDHDVLLSHPAVGTVCLRMRDMSNDSVFLLSETALGLAEGAEVVLQVRDLEDAPKVRALVSRVDSEGLSLHYLLDD